MNTTNTIPDIEQVRADLKSLASSQPGLLPMIARETGINSSLLWKFMEKNGLNELGYSKVRQILPFIYGNEPEARQ